MQYVVVGIGAIAFGFVLGYWAKTLKYWNGKETVNLEMSRPEFRYKEQR